MFLELNRTKQKFPKNFERQEKILGHTIKIEFNEGTKITQQKGRRVQLQLQKEVVVEIENLFEVGHLKEIDKVTDEIVYSAGGNNDQEGPKCQNISRCKVAE